MATIPHNPEVIAIKMPGLDNVLVVLEHDLHEDSVVGSHDRGVEVLLCTRGAVGDAAKPEDSSNLVVVGEFQGGVGLDVGDAVDCIALLAADLGGRAGEPDGPGDVDHAVVVRTLGVGPWSACSEVRPKIPKKKIMG